MSLAFSSNPEQQADAVIAPTHADGIWSSRLADWLTYGLYWGVHVAALGVFFTGVTKTALVLFALTFWGRMFGITGGYHRYFSHRRSRPSRRLPVLARAARHRWRRRRVRCGGPASTASITASRDGPGDVHSPKRGFWYSHLGWIFDKTSQATASTRSPTSRSTPSSCGSNRWHFVPPVALAVACFAIGGMPGLFWGFFVSTMLLWHGTFTINSLVAPVRHAPLRRPTTPARTTGARAAHLRRGLAQQPPPLHGDARARASAGGRSTSPTTCCAVSPPSASSGTCASRPRR